MKRTRGSSSSSNETILEACSSSPSIHNSGRAGTAQSSPFPLDPSTVPLPRSLTSGQESTAKTGNSHNVGTGKTVPGDKEQEIEERNADDDSEESIDWDAHSDEDTANNAPQPRQVVKRAKLPQTMAFHVDWWIARIGTAAANLDFKVLCASMMLWREKNEVLQVPTYCMMLSSGPTWEEDDAVSNSAPAQIPQSTSRAPLPLRGADRSSAPMLDWDVLLEDIRRASEQMHQDRKWRIRGKKNAAGWCKWAARQRINQRGEFVDQPEVGYEVEREVDGRTWVIRLGYRRNEAVVENMDVDGEMADADDPVADEQGAGGGDAVQGTLNTPPNNNCNGIDVVMEEAPDP
ncbi:uncharacterized protein PV07_06492 [Cladophialophora immunda]|uniref:Uncharacterized protein n=1 Tax=Cladophialophora immunda TaxID=569365 RepID=A0A0D2ANK3_9EURO|nr:uncharacterized protein PV07_06492 [Cladophialophora immunda]KIW26677.1 hypothetical protein PV07_06492 [Cladophialophora immunda]